MIKLSVVVITFNEERNIARCLDSVRSVADEMLVIDSDSTDRTVEISLSRGARVINQDFLGFAGQRNFGDQHAAYRWVLMLDADEWLSPELAADIVSFKQNPGANACKFPRLNRYKGKWIRHGTWYPDRKLRLYDKTKGSWVGGSVHEYWQPFDAGERIHLLKGDLLHDSFSSHEAHMSKIEKYTDLAAHDSVGEGKTASVWKMYGSAAWAFINNYIVRRGFLDGNEGLQIAKLSAKMSYLKYHKIRKLYKLQYHNAG